MKQPLRCEVKQAGGQGKGFAVGFAKPFTEPVAKRGAGFYGAGMKSHKSRDRHPQNADGNNDRDTCRDKCQDAPDQTVYCGERTALHGVVVTRQVQNVRDANGAKGLPLVVQELPLRLDLRNHSPTGFEWSYSGSGPAQLALALLADALGDDERALLLNQAFKWRVVACLPDDGWNLTRKDIRRIARQLEREQQAKAPMQTRTAAASPAP